MKFHIVQMGETIDEITFLYNLTKDELKEENKHIRKWDKLIPGTKLKIPVITENIDLEVTEMEPFVEDYYPKIKTEEVLEDVTEEEVFKIIDDEEVKQENKNEVSEEVFKEDEEETPKEVFVEDKKAKKKNAKNINHQYYSPYYPYYYYSNVRVAYPVYYYPIYYRKK